LRVPTPTRITTTRLSNEFQGWQRSSKGLISDILHGERLADTLRLASASKRRAYAGKSENTHFECPSFRFPSSAKSTSASTYRSKDDAGIFLTVCKVVRPLPSIMMGKWCPGSPCAQSWIHSLPGVSSTVPFSLPTLIPDMRTSSYADSSRGALV
jgi:hypothetical protein